MIANGRELLVVLPCSLHGLLESQGLPPRSVVVELNGEAIPPSRYGSQEVRAGDRLEIVKVVAGG